MRVIQTFCVILVGGLGTRLRAALPDLPKPMAPIQGRPFLEYLLADLKQQKIENIVLCVGHQAGKIEEYFGDGKLSGLNIEYSREEGLLGTAGAVRWAHNKIKSDNFLLLNGDCYNDGNFAELLSQHQSTRAIATLLATHVEDRARFGSLQMDENNRVLGFIEKGEATGAGWINAGVYALNRSVLELIPEGKVCSLERDVFPQLVARGEMFAFYNHGAFIDIGLPEEWQRAQTLVPGKIKL
jgi:D-glycero-alpha-D-manno-heptose 1-phosphate guanylyltransferase